MTRPRRGGKNPETIITNAIRSMLKIVGMWHWKAWQGPMSTPKGVADIIGIRRVKVADLVKAGRDEVGVFCAVEVKTERGHLTPEQERFGAHVVRNGGIFLVARSVDDAIEGLGYQNCFLSCKPRTD